MRLAPLVFILATVGCGANPLSPTTPHSTPTVVATAPATVPAPVGVFAVTGNSLTQSRNGAVAMPVNVMHDLGDPSGLHYVNAGVNGQTTPEMLASFDTLVRPLYHPNQLNVLLVWEGENDLYFGATAGEAFDHLRSYGQLAKAAGFTVVTLTLLPRGDVTVPSTVPATYEADRLVVNQLLRANRPTFTDVLVDIAADPIMGDPQQDTEGVYISPIDDVHLTDLGSQRIAGLVADAIRPLLGAR